MRLPLAPPPIHGRTLERPLRAGTASSLLAPPSVNSPPLALLCRGMAAPSPRYNPAGAFGSPGLPLRSPVLATPLQPQQHNPRKRTQPSAGPTPIVLHTVERGSLHATAHVPTRAPLGSLPSTVQRYTATVKFEAERRPGEPACRQCQTGTWSVPQTPGPPAPSV